MMDGIHSTRRSPPTYQLKRPIQQIPLDILLTTTNDILLKGVITTLQDHSIWYHDHLEEQQLLYSTYVTTMAKSQTLISTMETVTKPCNKQTSCKSPAIFKVQSTRMDINTTLELEAEDIRRKASSYFFTMVDSRVCTQIALAISKINTIVQHLELHHNDSLIDLAWSCLEYLWQQLKSITMYPPVQLFLQQVAEKLSPVISGNTATMDRLLKLFESDSSSINYLYITFDPNKEDESGIFLQRLQQISRIIISTIISLETPPLSALEYLIRSFDLNTWTSKEATGTDESVRQTFYIHICDTIRQLSLLRLNNEGTGDITGHLEKIYSAHMMTMMSIMIQKQRGHNQGEHLYILHLLLDTIATTFNNDNNNNKDDDGDIGDGSYLSDIFTGLLDLFTQTILYQQTTALTIFTQSRWREESQPNMRSTLTLLDDPSHTLDILLTILSQHCITYHDNLMQVYGPSTSKMVNRLVFVLLLDPRIDWNFDLLIRSFELHWKLPVETTASNSKDGGYQLYQEEENQSEHMVSTEQTIMDTFGLVMELWIYENKNDTKAIGTIFEKLLDYCHNTIDQMNLGSLDRLYKALATLSWWCFSPSHSDINSMINTAQNLCKYEDRHRYRIYSTFLYTMLQQIMINNDSNEYLQQHPPAILDHDQFMAYVKLVFVLLMNADLTWTSKSDRHDKLQQLWMSIIKTDLSGKLNAQDIDAIMTTTGIDLPSNWQGSLENRYSYNNDGNDNMDQDNGLNTCIQWLRYLTIQVKDDCDMDLIMCFGRFILSHLAVVENILIWLDWFKVLFDYADELMTKRDTTNNFELCAEWFQLLTTTLLTQQQQHQLIHEDRANNKQSSSSNMDVIAVIQDVISTSDYNTALAMFTACTPSPRQSFFPLKQHSKIQSEKSEEELVKNKLMVMEYSLEHCFKVHHDEDVWLRAVTLVCNVIIYNNNNHDNDNIGTAMIDDIEHCLSGYIQYSMDLSCLLLVNIFCRVKLQLAYTTMDRDNKDERIIDKDHHAAEEIAAILSLMYLDGTNWQDLNNARKMADLVQRFARLLSNNKGKETSLNRWIASLVSLTRSSGHWCYMTTNDDDDTTGLVRDDHHQHDDGSAWKAWALALECFLSSRLALAGIPPYSGMVSKTGTKKEISICHWIKILDQKLKHQGLPYRNLYAFSRDVVENIEQWSLWELDSFIQQTTRLSLYSTLV
ncbi:uncharacterized protein BX664DRAFT_340771 [Halteromyces radiatus]|uniref:uncharacterized protein n=1 Tax=Halteromyces radiatus TaxID=101107 RepID=UPI00221EC4B2|nr:uncharacterized protein BX664DRAFT_340771 [Halteromyces radiatus]KAI8081587.1 hypothetical protein BX664DRAFT_340771 [Halteromyces radiatus]